MSNVLDMTGKLTEKWDSLSPRNREIFSRIILFLPFCVMLVVAGLNFRLIGDEGPWTVRVVEKFSTEWPFPNLRDYQSSTTPLPYLAFTVYGKVVGFEIWKLRLLTVFLTFFAVNIFYSLCKRLKLPSPLFGALGLLFFPYVFFHGFTVYTVCFALFFEVLALRYYLVEDPSLNDLIKGGIAATLAIYCRQEYLALPVGLLLYEFFYISKGNLISAIKTKLLNLIILAMPLMLILPLFILWGGTNPPLQQTEFYLTIVPQHLSFALIFVGFYFLPAILSQNFSNLLKNKMAVFIVFLILTPIFIVFPLTYSEEVEKIAVGKGIIPHGIDLLSQYLGGTVGVIVKVLLWTIGILAILTEVMDRERDSVKMKLFSVLAAFVGLIMLTPYVAERYYIIAVAPLVLIFYKSQRDWRINLLWIVFLILLSAVFFYWQINLKSFDNW